MRPAWQLKAKLVVQGANIPATAGAERALHERGVLVVPDFVANSGGVICAAMEYHGASQSQVLAAIEEKIRGNTRLVLDASAAHRRLSRDAALEFAQERVTTAMSYRRWAVF